MENITLVENRVISFRPSSSLLGYSKLSSKLSLTDTGTDVDDVTPEQHSERKTFQLLDRRQSRQLAFGAFEYVDLVYGVFETSPVSIFAASSVSAQPAMT